jgi:hypothetical protein
MLNWKYLAIIFGLIVGLLALFLPEGEDLDLAEFWLLEDDLKESDEE